MAAASEEGSEPPSRLAASLPAGQPPCLASPGGAPGAAPPADTNEPQGDPLAQSFAKANPSTVIRDEH